MIFSDCSKIYYCFLNKPNKNNSSYAIYGTRNFELTFESLDVI